MPTVGWIQETAEERFWEGQTRIAPARVPPPVFVCGRCGKKLRSAAELSRHYSLEHPLELPSLYVRGEPLLRESVIRSQIKAEDVVLVQCSHCEVQEDTGSWRKLSAADFQKFFTQHTNSTCNLLLFHEREIDQARTREEYHVRFRIPETNTLNAVDEHFLRTLVLEELGHADLDRFNAGISADAPAREYGCALGDYALGIILKERRSPPHAPVGFEEFAVKMRSALDVLRHFDRPVALAVAGGIRFNLNDFRDHNAATAAELETGLHFFRRITGETVLDIASNAAAPATPKSSKLAVCPVDHVSHRLLDACASLSNGGRLSLADLEALCQLTRGMIPVSEQDLAKVHVICAEGYLRLGSATDAVPHLRAIQFDSLLKDWAQGQLIAITPHGN